MSDEKKDKNRNPNWRDNLLPPSDKNDPRFKKMMAGLEKYRTEQKRKKLEKEQAKETLEKVFQQLNLEDLAIAVEQGEIDSSILSPASLIAKTIEDLGDPVNLDPEGRKFWRSLVNDLRQMLGTEAAKQQKVEQNVTQKNEYEEMNKEELKDKIEEFHAKFKKTGTGNVVPFSKK